jgi:hypothetical protein
MREAFQDQLADHLAETCATDLRVVLSAATGRMGWPPLWT